MPTPFEIREILQKEAIVPFYQPIVSLKQRSVIGFEGLCRGIRPSDGSLLSPLELFGRAALEGEVLALDRLCRKKILSGFQPIHQAYPKLILSINFDASVIDGGAGGSGHLQAQVKEAGINPANVCIEIIESGVTNLPDLQHFVEAHRNHGFLMALDDVGAGHSNLNRIPLLKPDLIKIDRFLVQGIHGDFHKQQVFKSVVNLSRSLGTLVVAEGVETGQEALEVLGSGVDMIQGFYFSKPMEASECLLNSHREKVMALSEAYKELEIARVSHKRFNMIKCHNMIGELQTTLAQLPAEDFDQKLGQMAEYFPNVECFFVLDEKGMQVSENFLNTPLVRHKLLFQALPKGSDHSMKDYFYMLMEAGLGKITYVTDPYVSQVTGNICVTFASLFKNSLQKRYILCADINNQDFTI